MEAHRHVGYTRVDYTHRVLRNFPIGTDSLDDLVELHFSEPSTDRRKELMSTSWMLPTLAGWSVIYQEQELYKFHVSGINEEGYPDVCRQLWHPTSDLYENLYFCSAHSICGETEAPITFESELSDYRIKMGKMMAIERYKVIDLSPAHGSGLFGIDFVACRHFHTPVPPSFWYQFMEDID